MAGLAEKFAALTARIADLERRLASTVVHGSVAEVDPKAGTVRIDLGGGMLSPTIRYSQTAGALKIHTPPTKGQQMTMFSPSGDPQQAMALPFSWSDENASPSEAGDEIAMSFGEIKITLKGDEIKIDATKLKIDAGGTTFELSSDGLTASATKYDFD